jgi:hypothetical protein
MVYVPVTTELWVMPVPAAIALRVVVADAVTVHGLEHELEFVVGMAPFVV